MKCHLSMGVALALLAGCATSGKDGTVSQEPVLHVSVKRIPPDISPDHEKFIISFDPEKNGNTGQVTKLITKDSGISEDKGGTNIVMSLIAKDSEWCGIMKSRDQLRHDVNLHPLAGGEGDWLIGGTMLYSGITLIAKCESRKGGKINLALRVIDVHGSSLRMSIHLDTTVAEGEMLAFNARGDQVPPSQEALRRQNPPAIYRAQVSSTPFNPSTPPSPPHQ